jgi:hypothetical protein
MNPIDLIIFGMVLGFCAALPVSMALHFVWRVLVDIYGEKAG